MAGNSSFENYKIISEHKKSRYALLKENETCNLVIADLVNLKIIYELNSKKCKYLYVRPKDLFVNIPKICHLESKEGVAKVIFLREYSKSSLSGILVFEDDTLLVFNCLDNSMIRIKNIKKSVIMMYYGFYQEDEEVYSEYKVKVRYIDSYDKLCELVIVVSNKFDIMNRGNGIVLKEIMYLEPQKKWYFNCTTLSNLEDIFVRDIDALKINDLFENDELKSKKTTCISNRFLGLNYKFLL